MLFCITFLATSLITEASSSRTLVSQFTFERNPVLWISNSNPSYGSYNVLGPYDSASQRYHIVGSRVATGLNFTITQGWTPYSADSSVVSAISADKYYLVETTSGADYYYTTHGNDSVHFDCSNLGSYYTLSNGRVIPYGTIAANSGSFFYIKGSDILGTVNSGATPVVMFDGTRTLNLSIHDSTATSIDIHEHFIFTFRFYEVSKSEYLNSLNNQVNDSGTQDAINNQTSKVEQGNQIAQENSNTNKDTNNKITDFFSGFFDNLVHIFVPEDGFFSQWFSDLNDFMSQKLGFLWSPFDFMLSFLNGVYSGGGSASLVFPELPWIDGTVIIPRTEFSFDNIGGESFQGLRDMIYFATDVILLGAVISQFYKKIKLVFEGGGD